MPFWHSSSTLKVPHPEETVPKVPTPGKQATAPDSLGTEVISSQAGIVDLQQDIGIVHSGCEDLQVGKT